MSEQVTIIGLGQIGSSIGMALQAHQVNLRRVGHDKDPRVAKQSQTAGAVDDVKYNLPAAVRGAKLVILALPLAGIQETLQIIGPDLQEGTLVLDTAPAKAKVAAWSQEFLPPGRFYVGLTPAINPDYLHGTESGVSAARADLFEKGLIVVNTPTGTPGNVFNLAMELVNLLGARPLLMDTVEADGIFSAMHLLPQLAAAGLLNATVEQPGWLEARKLGGRPYATVSAGAAYHDDGVSLGQSALHNREHVVRLLDTYIDSLIDLREEIQANDGESLTKRLESARKGRARWLEERTAGEWLQGQGQAVDAPSFGQRLGQMFLGTRLANRSNPRK